MPIDNPKDSDRQIEVARDSAKAASAVPMVLGYGFAIVGCMVALGLGLVFRSFGVEDIALPLFNLAIVVTGWYAGLGPAILSVILSATAFNYYFTQPLYSFAVEPSDIPAYFTFTLWIAVSAWFVVARRRIEDDLRNARDHLEVELEQNERRSEKIRELNVEIADRAAQLQASNNELESFAYSVSHDLRAPLRHIAGYAELLQRQGAALLDDKCRGYALTIIESSKRMGDLIDDLLAFSRIGRAETRESLVNMDQLVKEVVAEIVRDIPERSIEWKISALPACYGDRSMLRQVVSNLVSNSVKFTRHQPAAQITIGSRYTDEGETEIFFSDNGAGFDMEYAKKLFGVFQRLHRAEEFEGTGIGLAIVQRIIQRHGGRVRAEGVVNEGATVAFTIPKTRISPGENRGNK